MPRRDDPQRRVQLFKRLDGPLLGQKGETRRGVLAHGEVTSRKDDGSGERRRDNRGSGRDCWETIARRVVQQTDSSCAVLVGIGRAITGGVGT